ncbi:MAG: type II toxin-antitoxin system RelE/ParE family toxin [Patulibacter sp.]
MAWDVCFGPEAREWVEGLGDKDFKAIMGAVDVLEREGPALGRPIVDTIKGSRHANMKELRSVGGHLRALFAFDPRRQALVLLGGDKTDDWQGWYERNIPIADDLFDDYLAHLRDENPEG